MSVVIWYLLMVALLSFITSWSMKKGGNDVTVGGMIFIVFLSAIPLVGAIITLLTFVVNVLLNRDAKTIFGKTIIKGD